MSCHGTKPVIYLRFTNNFSASLDEVINWPKMVKSPHKDLRPQTPEGLLHSGSDGVVRRGAFMCFSQSLNVTAGNKALFKMVSNECSKN
jgi:hypothetical protein